MSTLNLLALVCLAYVILLFGVAFAADKAAQLGRGNWLRSPVVYTLSLSIYCTAWTFYGAVGFAARSGLEFVTIYLGPTLVVIGWWGFLRKMVRIGRSQRITSIADMLSSRYGKSNALAVAVTLIAVVGTTPYIALQLQSVTASVSAFTQFEPLPGGQSVDNINTALWITIGLAVFTILFGTRNLDVNERHHGVVIAIAVEAIVKLVALMAVGVFVVWGLGKGAADIAARIDASKIALWEVSGGRWIGLTMLSAAAFLCLPRMFQVMVVENQDESHLRTASWLFPTYLMLMSLFVVPIAVMGLHLLPNENPDLFVLTLPLAAGQDGLAILSFLGGFSSATSMVIVAAIALSTMVSNHIVMPIWLRITGASATMSGDVRQVALLARRVSIAAIVSLGYLYFRVSGGGAALAAIGLIAFTGVAQFLPALVGGLTWRGATKSGALAGLGVGFVFWIYCLFLPSFGPTMFMPQSVFNHGLLGLSWLRPYALFGTEGMDSVVHAVFWSLSLNTLTFVAVSMFTFPTPLERLQGAQFVNVFDHSRRTSGRGGGFSQSEDLLLMVQRITGADEARELFSQAAREQGQAGSLPVPTPEFIETLERKLSGSVGAATAHAMVSQIIGGANVSVDDLLAVADETAQVMEYSTRLEAKSKELARTARKLREANAKLTQISAQKDSFLSQVSHELRTPMASIRAFSEIMQDANGLSPEEHAKFAKIIHDEALRLTRLLDDLLDLSVLESGQVDLNQSEGWLNDLLDRAVASAGGTSNAMIIHRDTATERVKLNTDLDRLVQVFINLIANARKYCEADQPELRIEARRQKAHVVVDFIDNGKGIPEDHRAVIFEKFARVGDSGAGGAGLGLAICREIMQRLGGDIVLLPSDQGAAFRVTLPPQDA